MSNSARKKSTPETTSKITNQTEMPLLRDIKLLARAIHKVAKARGKNIGRAECQEAVAAALGFKTWFGARQASAAILGRSLIAHTESEAGLNAVVLETLQKAAGLSKEDRETIETYTAAGLYKGFIFQDGNCDDEEVFTKICKLAKRYDRGYDPVVVRYLKKGIAQPPEAFHLSVLADGYDPAVIKYLKGGVETIEGEPPYAFHLPVLAADVAEYIRLFRGQKANSGDASSCIQAWHRPLEMVWTLMGWIPKRERIRTQVLLEDKIISKHPPGGDGLFDVVVRRNEEALRVYLSAGVTSWIPTPEKPNGGSVVGMCASEKWLRGIAICQEFEIDPNRDAMLRDPLVWAFENGDVNIAEALLDMGMDPMGLMPDPRSEVGQCQDVLDITKFTTEKLISNGDIGACDVYVLKEWAKLCVTDDQKDFPKKLVPRIAAILANFLSPNSLEIHRVILSRFPQVRSHPVLRHFISISAGRLWNLLRNRKKQKILEDMRTLCEIYGHPDVLEIAMGDWRQWSGRPFTPPQHSMWLLAKDSGPHIGGRYWFSRLGWDNYNGNMISIEDALKKYIPLALGSDAEDISQAVEIAKKHGRVFNI
jgi:hypothetical protein